MPSQNIIILDKSNNNCAKILITMLIWSSNLDILNTNKNGIKVYYVNGLWNICFAYLFNKFEECYKT